MENDDGEYPGEPDLPGGLENLQILEQPQLTPKEDEIVVRHDAIGMNFVDIYHRRGSTRCHPIPP